MFYFRHSSVQQYSWNAITEKYYNELCYDIIIIRELIIHFEKSIVEFFFVLNYFYISYLFLYRNIYIGQHSES